MLQEEMNSSLWSNTSHSDCGDEGRDNQRLHGKITTVVLAIFFVSLLGVGMGQTAVYTLGIPYIDDNVASRESPLYFGKSRGRLVHDMVSQIMIYQLVILYTSCSA
jgi:hypothetical protein